jgi:hypothetical protein
MTCGALLWVKHSTSNCQLQSNIIKFYQKEEFMDRQSLLAYILGAMEELSDDSLLELYWFLKTELEV